MEIIWGIVVILLGICLFYGWIYIIWLWPIKVSKKLALEMGMDEKAARASSHMCIVLSWFMVVYLDFQLKLKKANDQIKARK